MSRKKRFYGLYRATVVNNLDPLLIGRIQVLAPDVPSLVPTSWAMPSVPIAGKLMGTFVVPPVGAAVWVQFEQGDPDFPVWTGGFWAIAAEVPPLVRLGVPGDPSIVFTTTQQNSIAISDLPGPTGGITLQSPSGATIIVNDTGIYIQNGKGASLVMVGPTVTINEGALVVI